MRNNATGGVTRPRTSRSYCPMLCAEPKDRLAAIGAFTVNLGARRLHTSTLRRRVRLGGRRARGAAVGKCYRNRYRAARPNASTSSDTACSPCEKNTVSRSLAAGDSVNCPLISQQRPSTQEPTTWPLRTGKKMH